MNDALPHAEERRSRWPGWIWAVPIAACAIVAYLAFQQISQRGPSVTVSFSTAGGIKASDTKVRFEGIDVGEVVSVTFEQDLRHVNAVLHLHADMAGHLGKGTRFWIAGQKPSISDLSSLKSIISGPYIGIEPHPGKIQDRYEGLTERPVTANDTHGTHYVLTAETLGTISHDSPIYYRDMQVGLVEDTRLTADHRHFHVDVFVNAPFDTLVHEGTRFWDASAVQLSLAAGNPKLQLQSLPSLFEGAVDFETPDDPVAGARARPDSTFTLYSSRDLAENAPNERAARYRVVFHGAGAGGLDSGAAVKLQDRRVGSVTDATLQYDPRTGQLDTMATLALEPRNIMLAGGDHWTDDPRLQLNAMLRHLIGQGLRARLGSTVPMVGGKDVELAFVPHAAPASLGDGPVPLIPSGPQSDVTGILASVNAVAAKIDAMPLDQIAEDVHQTTQRLAALSNSPKVTESMNRLDESLANVEQITRDAKAQAGPILVELHRVAQEAQSTVTAARNLISNNGAAQARPRTDDLGNTLYELSRAARSLRELADYLDRHPEALLRGKGNPG
ncbi:MAG TPA: MlaD family protein [Acetobacteraceae bacterium]|jgi:paraquat-inducible protein B